MNTSFRIAGFSVRWEDLNRIFGTLATAFLFLIVANSIYEEVWPKEELTYTLLQPLDLGDQFLSGLIVQNSGSVPLTYVRINVAYLGIDIEKINIPYVEEPIEPHLGGEGTDGFFIEVPSLSVGKEVPIYLFTANAIDWAEPTKVIVTSAESLGVEGVGSVPPSTKVSVLVIIALILFGLLVSFVFFSGSKRKKK